MRFRWFAGCVLMLFTAVLHSQTQPVSAPVPCPSETECAARAEQVARQFGPDFKVLKEFSPLFGDLDGDGQEDAVVVASGSPLGGQIDFSYKVVDPHNAYFGWGDPDVTATFEATNVGPRRNLLVSHSWQAEKQKAKFVIINLPFERLSLGRTVVKKRTVWGIRAEETSSLFSVTFWDGKKYRWRADYVGE